MPDWLISWLGYVQGDVLRTLLAQIRSGGLGTLLFAFGLGALHALTPGHGKTALAAFFLGSQARAIEGLRVALSAALLHVMSGLVAFIVLRLILRQLPTITDRGPAGFTVIGYGFIVLAGLIMVSQSFARRSGDHRAGRHALTFGIGLLPCPLTITVLGFAWTQSNPFMIGVVLLSLALGIATTIGLVALAAILGRRGLAHALLTRMPQIDRWGRAIQALAGVAMIGIGTYIVAASLR